MTTERRDDLTGRKPLMLPTEPLHEDFGSNWHLTSAKEGRHTVGNRRQSLLGSVVGRPMHDGVIGHVSVGVQQEMLFWS